MSLARAEGCVPAEGNCDRQWRFSGGDRGRHLDWRNGFDVAQMIGDHVSVVLVGTRAEAIAATRSANCPASRRAGADDRRPAAAPVRAVAVASDRSSSTPTGGSRPGRGRSVPLSPLEHDVLCCLLAELGHTWPFERTAPPGLGERPPRRPLRRAVGRQAAAPQAARAGLPDRDPRRARRRASGWSTGATPRAPRRRFPRLEAWTSTPPTPTGSPGSRPARCRWRSPTRRPTRAPCSSRRAPATTTAWRWRSSPSCA